MASVAVAAQAQTANVTVYGGLRAALEVAKYAGPAGSARITSMENISSRWGMRGSESLGGGLNAIFQLESGFGIDNGAAGSLNGATQLFNREAWVGLQGGFGTLRLGYGLTPFDDVLGMAHHQGANSWENRNNGVGGGAGFAKRDLFTNYASANQCNSSAFDARYGNSISYATPNMSGVVVRTQYAFVGETSSNACKAWDTAITYRQGPLALGATYALHSNFTGLGSVVALHDQKAMRLFAGFDAKVVRFTGTYEAATYSPASGSLKYKYWDLGALAPIGAATAGVQYSQRDKGLAAGYNPLTQALTVNAATLANWNNGGGKHLAVTLDYPLSRRTMIRSYYAQLKNETGAKVTALSSGLWHSF
ncbi:MAG: porin [Burkholderiales bacterium]|nr:MAG: porin [Burkholderiales bacterium]